MMKKEKRLSTNKMIASVQVDFSRKSAVLRTPINWLDPEKLEANPPPFEFWTKTTRVSKTHVIRISTETKIYIAMAGRFSFYDFCCNFSIWAAK
jgi:hypothetical protein